MICTDLWKPYPAMQVVKEKVGQTLQALERFPAVMNLNKGLDEVRPKKSRS